MKKSDGLTALSDAIDQALQEEVVGSPVKPVNLGHDRWSATMEKRVEWKSQIFGTIAFELQTFSIGEKVQDGLNTFAELNLMGKRPSQLWFVISRELKPGIRMLHAKAGRVTDVTEGRVPNFSVEIKWDGTTPHSREKDADNFDIVLLDPSDAVIMQIQVSVTTRNGKFWVAAQEIYAGQICKTVSAKADKIGLQSVPVNGASRALVAPLFQENAYPGADYLRTFPRMGPEVIKYATERGISVPLSHCHVAKWEPVEKPLPDELKAKGYAPATILWFNTVIGWGFAQCEDGKVCRVHFSKILNQAGKPLVEEGEFPLLSPMRTVAIKYTELPDGKREATAIRRL